MSKKAKARKLARVFGYIFFVLFVLQAAGSLVLYMKGGFDDKRTRFVGYIESVDCSSLLRKSDLKTHFFMREQLTSQLVEFYASFPKRIYRSCETIENALLRDDYVEVLWSPIRNKVWELRVGNSYLISYEDELEAERKVPWIIGTTLVISVILLILGGRKQRTL